MSTGMAFATELAPPAEFLREDGNQFSDEMARFIAPQLLEIGLSDGLS